jgi:uncharacterized membrane protein YoaK (UPF0700 family)
MHGLDPQVTASVTVTAALLPTVAMTVLLKLQLRALAKRLLGRTLNGQDQSDSSARKRVVLGLCAGAAVVGAVVLLLCVRRRR